MTKEHGDQVATARQLWWQGAALIGRCLDSAGKQQNPTVTELASFRGLLLEIREVLNLAPLRLQGFDPNNWHPWHTDSGPVMGEWGLGSLCESIVEHLKRVPNDRAFATPVVDTKQANDFFKRVSNVLGCPADSIDIQAAKYANDHTSESLKDILNDFGISWSQKTWKRKCAESGVEVNPRNRGRKNSASNASTDK